MYTVTILPRLTWQDILLHSRQILLPFMQDLIPNITPDGVFFLDWEAFPNKEVEILPPQLLVLEGKTRAELSKNFLNSANYDLTYAIETHMIVQVRPADLRDMPMKEDGRVFMIGNQHQTAIYGNTKHPLSILKVMETTLHFTPTGLGENVAYMGYFKRIAIISYPRMTSRIPLPIPCVTFWNLTPS